MTAGPRRQEWRSPHARVRGETLVHPAPLRKGVEFTSRFEVEAPLHEVMALHGRAAALADLAPPRLVHVLWGPRLVEEGAAFGLRVLVGPFPVAWKGRYCDVNPHGFTDVQERGPFESWTHRHEFRALAGARTEVSDRIDAQLAPAGRDRLVGRLIWASLPALFAYRRMRTRAALRNPPAGGG